MPVNRVISVAPLLLAGILLLGCARQDPAGPSKPQPNNAQASASGNGQNWSTERGFTRSTADDARVDAYRANYAIIIGIDGYPGGESVLHPLRFAVNDARAVRDILREEFGYRDDRIQYLTDDDATRVRIEDAFQEWLPAQALSERDSIFVFFAGHGLIAEMNDDGYLAASDSCVDDLPGTCLSVAWIRDKLAALPCLHKVVVLDSCYSGSLFQRLRTEASEPNVSVATRGGHASTRGEKRDGNAHTALSTDKMNQYLRCPAFLGLSAARETPAADGLGRNQHSIFTATLLDVLRRRADSPRPDQAFTFRQLATAVEKLVAADSRTSQVPDFGYLGPGDGDFVFRPRVIRKAPVEFTGPAGLQIGWLSDEGRYVDAHVTAPGQYVFHQGWIYRLKITNVPGHPGTALYPTLNISVPERHDSRLADLAIPITFTDDDFRHALSGRSITKVLYLLDPSMARPPLGTTAFQNPANGTKETGKTRDATRFDGELFFCQFSDSDAEAATENPPIADDPPIFVRNESDERGASENRPDADDPGDRLLDLLSGGRTSEQVVTAEVDRCLMEARRDLGDDPQKAIQRLKQVLQTVQQASEISANIRLRLVDKLESGLREAERVRVEAEARRIQEIEKQASIDDERRVREEVLRARQKVLMLFARAAFLLEEKRSEHVPHVVETAYEPVEWLAEIAPEVHAELRGKIDPIVQAAVRQLLPAAEKLLPEDPESARKILVQILGMLRPKRGVSPQLSQQLRKTLDPTIQRVDRMFDPSRIQTLSSTDLDSGRDAVVEASLRGMVVAVVHLGDVKRHESQTVHAKRLQSGNPASTAPRRFPATLLSGEQRRLLRCRQIEVLTKRTEQELLAYALKERESPYGEYFTIADAIRTLTCALEEINSAEGVAPRIKEDASRRLLLSFQSTGTDMELATKPSTPRRLRRSIEILRTRDSFPGCLETPLSNIGDFFLHKMEVRVDWDALKEIGIDRKLPVTTAAGNASLDGTLRRVFEDLPLAFYPTETGILVTTAEREIEHRLLMVYPVFDLVYVRGTTDGHDLAEHVKRSLAPDTWKPIGEGEIEFVPAKYQLRVNQPWSVHRQIWDFLEDQRAAMHAP